MLFIIILLLLFSFILSLSLGLSIAVAYLLTWLLPNISFEIGAVIGAICSSFTLYCFLKLILIFGQRDMPELNRSYIVDEEYNGRSEEEEYQVITDSFRPTKRRRHRRKRKL